MANDSSATVRETPYANRRSRTNTIVDALKQRAEAVLNDRSIDPQSRAVIRYALETNDPWLARLVRSANDGENVFDVIESETSKEDSDDEKSKALAELICRAGDKSAAALFLLMGAIENSTRPKALANIATEAAYTRCGELSDLLVGMS